MTGYWVRLIILGFFVWCSFLSLQGQVAEGESFQPTPIAEVNRLLTDPTQTMPKKVSFKGIAIFVSRVGDICVQNGDDGVMVEPPGESQRPALGQEVEVQASVKFKSADFSDPDLFLVASNVKLLSQGVLPAPKKPWLAEALNGKESSRWVEVEGIVMQAALERGVVMLHVTDQSGWAVITVHDWKEGISLRDWWGAKIKVKCANVGRGHRSLRVMSSDQITVVRPGVNDLFAAPEADLLGLRTGKKGTPDRMKTMGRVLAIHDDIVYLRCEKGPVRASLLAAFFPNDKEPHPLKLLPPGKLDLRLGDEVELVGSPLRVEPYVEFSFSSFRLLGKNVVPDPLEIQASVFSSHLCDRVKLKAEVRGYEQNVGARGTVETLTVESLGVMFKAVQESEMGGQLRSHRVNDVLELTGTIIPGRTGQPPFLRLAGVKESTADQVAVVQRALPPLVIRVIGFLVAGLALALISAAWLQRKVKSRTAALAVANDSLRAEVVVREKAEADLAKALKQERELGELKSRFVTTVSHEFRTPLGITMSAVELLRHYEDRLPKEEKAQLYEDIHVATKNMAGLMEQVLVLGRVDAGKLAFKPAAIDLDSFARRLVDETLSATNRKCPIHWTVEGDLTGAKADEALLRHIFTNLLSNAVKYSAEGSIVEFSAKREGDSALFMVKDHGIGIPEADLPDLFDAFHRASNVGDIPGTGLGLVISKRCVDLHGGLLSVNSKVGEGTTFTISIPAWS